MAIDVGELLVSIKADLTDLKKGLDDANKKVGEFGAGTVAKGALIASAIAQAGKTVLKFGKDSILAYGESQEAVSRLELALRNSGQEVDLNSKRLIANATALQNLSGVSDEAIIRSQTLLVSFGLAGETLDKTTKAALDLSKGLGIDLNAATLLLGKAAAGETSTLSRYGIIIDENVPKSKKFEVALKAVNDRFGGQAQANVEGVNGKIAVLTQRLNDAQEIIGKHLVPALDFWGRALGMILDHVEKTTSATKKEAQGRELTILTLKKEIAAIREKTIVGHGQNQMVRALTAEEQKQLNLRVAALAREKVLLAEEVEAKKAATAAIVEDKKFKSNQELLIEAQARQEQKEADEKAQKEREELNATRVKNFRDTLNFISTLATEKNKILATIGKAAAISMATIDALAAYNVALKSAPPPFNFALAAAVVAAGMANVAKMSGVKLARGGIVEARQGGTSAVIGEGGSAEAVIPLEDRKSKKMLGDALSEAGAGGGITLTFNISGHFIEGSPAKLQRMFREAIIPEIRRYSEVNPNGSFNRRRGQR